MKNIKLITDSTCDLSNHLIEQHDIKVIPLHVSFGDETYEDGVTLSTKEMYEKVKEKNLLPKTAAISPGEFEEVFKEYLDQGYSILYVGIGSKFSATFQSAMLAKQMLENNDIHLVDSANLSSGTGLLLLKAAKYKEEGYSVEEIQKRLVDLVPRVRSQFVIDTLEYLYKGGRLNALSAFMGKMLRVHPLIKVVDGEMQVGKKAMGSMKKGLHILLNQVKEENHMIDEDFMMITHSMASGHYNYVKDKIDNLCSVNDIYETHAGCVISTHCGAGTIGVLYIVND